MESSLIIGIDAGPLAAAFNRKDPHHRWVLETFKQLAGPFYTSESVLSETLFLLDRNNVASESLLEMLERGAVRIGFDPKLHMSNLIALIRRYADQPMSLADATLVRLAELHENATIFTLDRHFRIYRKHGRRQIPLIIPEHVK